ncbi:GPI transamidase component PIG-S [Colletes gigas]|uniref:GPI transamidase component PIG-S n=1 Tax=Colletes gigas TaxID=935657 RepID=UPI001C9B3510|nr:GPI transamidase component PIG-S [Colletes gigas]XP_043265013.1 GPI transamidase component PIG-S [Colletes gigas]XP_043265014.1 GPI transamidase component PIG-S [Colletes gigas]
MGEEVDDTTIDYDTAIDEKYRIYASISFAVLLLGIGVPLWWHTTAVQRVSLPYAGIDGLSNLDVKIKIKLVLAILSERRAEKLTRELTEAFENTAIYKVEIVSRIIPVNLTEHDFKYTNMDKVAASNFNLDIGELLLMETNAIFELIYVGWERGIYFSPQTNGSTLAQILSEWMLREKSLILTKNALAEPTLYSLDVENRRRFPASPAYDVLITVVNPNPEKLKVDWDLRKMAEKYVEPFLSKLSISSNFSVKSQWLYLLPLEVNPKRVPDSSLLGRHFALPEDVLPQLITPLEKKLASQVSLHPTINFVIYAVPCDNAPLHIYTRSGHRSKSNVNVEAFLSPRWGGVVFINPSLEACADAKSNESVTIVPEEITVIGTFLAQLKLLLGIPEPKPLHNVLTLPPSEFKLYNWEVDALLRIRTIEQLTSAKLTLQSLARLLKEIGNIVITDVVGDRIKTALRLVENSAERLAAGDLRQGFLLSKEAFVAAEAAFSDPTLLALLYFPEDQKYAVYIPLFLPAMIPVLLSLKNIYKHYSLRKVNA